jgi:hypothetical protein
MAGLPLKELKVRGLVSRTLILTPASLSFQWQREMKDKFRENFEIIRSDVLRANYGDVKSLEEAMRKHEAPFYLRRVKEALVSFPDPQTGKVKALFTKRMVSTTEFQITLQELDFYDALTRFVEDQSIKAASDALSALQWRCYNGASHRASTPSAAAFNV